GGTIQVNDLMAIIGAEGEDIAALLKEHSAGENAAAGSSIEENGTEKKAETMSRQEKAAKKDDSKEQPVSRDDASKDKDKGKLREAKESGVDISKIDEVILMPRLSDTMTEGVIAAWHKK